MDQARISAWSYLRPNAKADSTKALKDESWGADQRMIIAIP